MDKIVKEWLLVMADESYRQFQCKLCPQTENILGVRMPDLRRLAKKIVQDDWREYLRTAQADYYEEIMLQGLVIGLAKADLEEILAYTKAFVPKIDNWAVCDSFCSGLKMTRQDQAQVWLFLQSYVQSEQEFELRFLVVMLMDYYLDQTYFAQVMALLDQIKHEGYYVKMAVAWAVSAAFVKFPEQTMVYLQGRTLDEFTYNKALQKITESYRVDEATKMVIRRLKAQR